MRKGSVSVWKGLSEVLLEEVQQRNLIMFSRLWTSDAVPLIGINLEKQKKRTCSIITGSAGLLVSGIVDLLFLIRERLSSTIS